MTRLCLAKVTHLGLPRPAFGGDDVACFGARQISDLRKSPAQMASTTPRPELIRFGAGQAPDRTLAQFWRAIVCQISRAAKRTTADSSRNYGERWRHGDAISTAFVESGINAVLNKRFRKKQQMQWSKRGAHLLLQTRTRVLNGELSSRFQSGTRTSVWRSSRAKRSRSADTFLRSPTSAAQRKHPTRHHTDQACRRR